MFSCSATTTDIDLWLRSIVKYYIHSCNRDYDYVSGFAKIVSNCTRIEIQFILNVCSWNTKHMAIDGQVYFHSWLLLITSSHEGTLQGLCSQWVTLTRTWYQAAANDYLGLCSELLYIHFCYLKKQHCCLCPCGRYNKPPAAHPPQLPTHLLPPVHSIIHAIGYIIVSMKKLLKIEHVELAN